MSVAEPKLRMPDREEWSACPERVAPTGGDEVVVFVPPEASLGEGFEQARRELARGHSPVRVIGRGITLTERWPEWVRGATGLRLTELDAYLPSERTPLTGRLARDLDRWLADVLSGAVDDVRPERALWASATLRVFHPAFASWPLVLGLAHHHARHRVMCTDPHWIGAEALSRLVRKGGGEYVSTHPKKARIAFPLHLAAWGIASAVGAVCVRAYEFARERPSREKVRALRAEEGKTPRVWIGVFGDWPRVTRHATEGVGHAARTRGARIGILLYGSLRPGLRRENGPRPEGKPVVFPALEHPALQGIIGAVDQCVSVETTGALIKNAASSMARTARVLARVVRRGRFVTLGEMPIDLLPRVPALARLASFDVLRANEAVVATRALLRRRSFDGARIVWPHASLAVEATPDLLAQARGLTTYDLVHGSLYDTIELVTFDRTFSSVKVVWTEAEALAYGPYADHQRCVGGYVPRVSASTKRGPRARCPGEPLRVLALTNYLCGASDPQHPPRLECYQHAFFRALGEAAASCHPTAELRWRPHPSDSKSRVKDFAARFASMNMGLSLEPGGLGDDLAWADVVITSMSSVVVEALDYSVLILVHEIPFLDSAGVLSFFPAARRFRNGDDLAVRLRGCVEALDKRDSDGLQHELALERKLFGPGRQPRTLESLLWPQ